MADYVKFKEDKEEDSSKQIKKKRTKISFKGILLFFLILFILSSIISSFVYTFTPKIVVVPIKGVITTEKSDSVLSGSTISSREIANKLNSLKYDTSVKAVLIDLKPRIGIVTEVYHDFVFTYLGNPMTSPGGVRKSFKAACINAGIEYGEKTPGGLVFKDFRRSVKTNMAKAGISKVYRDTILGHTLQGMDVHYIKPSDDDLTDAIKKYTQWFDHEMSLSNLDQSLDQMAKIKKGVVGEV